ncbi:hypothetical protein PTSG_03525 [Salpingoeca rosetta]|uniref:Uncharacterized protein n=1 Tax=Salpingoeca rosetta (strain ATCC 50818 / BSB-021) TaxID=946362 RepID=F2U5V3_SALR5|nr:uncharacterized protein PTSG_03525 [Salpingoeca rosetta]EGD82894.1 hypothetical protein PTSG_03525 [Salpingoeca rosetta]|eukprot:XP_004995258.1 hypothetical protein PTSG_03525 [Salpingoeca rosetta]
MLLSGKSVLVTGASSGIGLATARVLAREGAKVCVTGRDKRALKAIANEIKAPFVVADLTKDGECERTVAEAVSALGQVTSLVNCAGVLRGGAIGTPACDINNYLDNFNINTRTVFEMIHHAVPHLKAAGATANPCIVNITSVNGKQSFGGCANYCASKAAADMLTRCAAVDLAPFNIRVNSVNPGVVMTELQKRGGLTDTAYRDFVQRSIEVTHPIAAARGKVGQPEEVGDLIAFLLSDKATFITGECIAIDGGRQCLGAR